MKTKNPLTVRPDSGSGLAELKRAESLIRLTESVLGKSIAPARNRTDEHGRKHGYWVERRGGSWVLEVPYVDGKRHGHWVFRLANDGVTEGPYVNGEKHGDWVVRYADGGVQEGPFVNGKKHCQWVVRDADGDVFETYFENGKKVDC